MSEEKLYADSNEQSDLATLMARDPLELSKADVGKIVEHLRGNRKRFLAGNQQAGSMKPKKETVKAKAAAESKSIIGDLGDLGL